MLMVLLSALLSAHLAAPSTTPPVDCLSRVSDSVAGASTPEFIPPGFLEELYRNSFSDEYVSCEIEAGNVVSLVVLRDGAAVATLTDGTSVEFILPDDAGWFTADAAGRGVTISAAVKPDITPPTEEPPTDSSGGMLGLAALAVAAAFSVFLLIRYRRRNPKRLLVQGVTANAQVRKSDVPTTRFADVAGCKEAIEDLAEMVDVLKDPEKYETLGARAPRGALLVGPPGTGKTLLARAVAGEAGVPFFSVAGSDFVEMYVGVGARRVRDVFERAKKAGSAIVFIDEIDAIGRRRSTTVASGGEQEHENTLIALLNELDGFKSSAVVVIGATNRADVLDPALTRPGRLDRKVFVGLPDAAEREEVLGVHVRNKKIAPGLSLRQVARRTPGFSGAQLEQVCNEAALIAARTSEHEIEARHFAAAVEYVAMGRARRSAMVSESDRRIAAWHEAGHTVAALRHQDADRPVAVSIVPRGAAGGVTWMEGSDTQMVSRGALRARLVVALAGRAAEERLLDGEYTAGAASDLEVATEIARSMVERYGMSDLGPAVRASSDDSTRAVDVLLTTAAQEARRLLDDNDRLLTAVATALLDRSDLDAEDLSELERSCA